MSFLSRLENFCRRSTSACRAAAVDRSAGPPAGCCAASRTADRALRRVFRQRVRSSDYGKCKSTGPDNSYGSVTAIGKQMEGILQRNAPEPANLNCARGINLLLKDVTPNLGDVFKLASDVSAEEIAFYKDYQQKLEALLATAQAPSSPVP